MLSFAGASRDPVVYADPDVFDLDREARDLLVFENGPHSPRPANSGPGELDRHARRRPRHRAAGLTRARGPARFQDLGLDKRPLNFPVEIAHGSR